MSNVGVEECATSFAKVKNEMKMPTVIRALSVFEPMARDSRLQLPVFSKGYQRLAVGSFTKGSVWFASTACDPLFSFLVCNLTIKG
jgi:hypothetical protein